MVSEMESAPGEDAVKTAEVTAKDGDCHIDLAATEAAACETTDSNERSSTVSEMLSDDITGCREIIAKRRSQPTWQTSFLSCFKRVPQPPLNAS